VSRDIFVQDIPSDARTAADIPDDWRPAPLPFDQDHVVAVVREVVPTADFSDPTWGRIDVPGVSIEVNISSDVPLRSFALHVRGDAAAADRIIMAILDRLGARAFDTNADGGIFGPGEGASA
jgi:hypothetical protein